MIRQQCHFCGEDGQLLFSQEQQCYVHTHCLVSRMTLGDPTAKKIAQEFDMIADDTACTVGCDECTTRWCGR